MRRPDAAKLSASSKIAQMLGAGLGGIDAFIAQKFSDTTVAHIDIVVRVEDIEWKHSADVTAGQAQQGVSSLMKRIGRETRSSKRGSLFRRNRGSSNVDSPPTPDGGTPTRSPPHIPKLPEVEVVPMFGTPLSQIMARQKVQYPHLIAPKWIEDAIAYVIARGLDTVGIFRLSGSMIDVETMKQALNSGQDLDVSASPEPTVVAALIKLFLRELPQPLCPSEDYAAYLDAAQQPTDDARVAALVPILERIPEHERNLLFRLCCFFGQVSKNAHVNKMPASNVAIVLGPNILVPPPSDDPMTTAMLAASSSDVNEVARVLVERPILVQPPNATPKQLVQWGLGDMLGPITKLPPASMLWKLSGHSKSVQQLAHLPSLDEVWSAGSKGQVFRWNVTNMKYTGEFSIGQTVMAMVYAYPWVWVSSEAGISVLNSSGDVVKTYPNQPTLSLCVVGDMIWAGCDRLLRVYSGATMVEEWKGELTTSGGLVFAFLYVESEGQVWAGTVAGDILVYDANTRALVHTLERAHTKRINDMCIVGRHVWTVSDADDVAIWDMSTFEPVHRIASAHELRIYRAILVGDNVWTSSWDKTIKVWNATTYELVTALPERHTDAIYDIILLETSTGTTVWTGSGDKSVCVWVPVDGEGGDA